MALTKTDLQSVEKVVNKQIQKSVPSIVREIVTEVVIDASEGILAGVQKMFDVRDARLDAHDKKLDALSSDMQALKQGQREIRDDIAGLSGELQLKASKKDLQELVARVDSYHPSN